MLKPHQRAFTTFTEDIRFLADTMSELSRNEKDDSEPIISNEVSTKDEYPMGLTLWLLVGSVMMAVFLIALDQASTLTISHLYLLASNI